jgi:hypothetical protein
VGGSAYQDPAIFVLNLDGGWSRLRTQNEVLDTGRTARAYGRSVGSVAGVGKGSSASPIDMGIIGLPMP